MLAVFTGAYLAAVYLAADSARRDLQGLEEAFRARALGAGTVSGVLAIGGLAVLQSDARPLVDQLAWGTGIAMASISGLAGVIALTLVYRRQFEPARVAAAVAVAAVACGWALAQRPAASRPPHGLRGCGRSHYPGRPHW